MIKATKDIIKVLPFDETFKQDLLSRYDTLDPDEKYNIDSILWDAYDAFYALKLDENLLLALNRAKEGNEQLDETFYQRIRQQTEQEMQKEEVTIATNVDLSDTRNKLQQLISPQTTN
jgi:hypothetical protein